MTRLLKTACGAILVCLFSLNPGRAQVRPQKLAEVIPSSASFVYPTNDAALEGKWHKITRVPPPNLPRIHWYNKLNPIWWFKNADEPKPPAWFAPGEKCRGFKWFLRNPFHNFSYYVIGFVDKTFVRSGRYPNRVSNPNGGWNYAVSRRRILLWPYLSYRRGKFEFYFGWRGNFGIKLNWKAERTHPLPPSNDK